MNLHEVLDPLPNGLHDAEVRRLTIDYVGRKVDCEVDIWIGSMGMSADGREIYRPARLGFGGLEYCVIEPPSFTYPYDSGEPLRVDLDDSDRSYDPCPPPRAGAASLFRVFVVGWNAPITICAATVKLSWSGPPINRDTPE